MAERLDLLRAEREDEERRATLENLMNEIHLFNLKQDERVDNSDKDEPEETDPNEPYNPPGIKFFEGYVNSIYTEESVRPESFSKLFEDSKDTEVLFEYIEWRTRYDVLVESRFMKRYVEYFFKLLFTEQSEGSLHTISCILLEMINKNPKPGVLLKMFVEELTPGIQNLGGRGEVISSKTATMNRSPSQRKEEFNPLPNLKYVVDVFKYAIVKEQKISKEKEIMSMAEIDSLFFIFMVVSHDPVVLSSSLVASIEDFVGMILDLYPSDSFSDKVQDLVEKLAIYWEDSRVRFNHQNAYYVTCSVLPTSRRGQHLKGSLAYYALMCCLTPAEESVEVVDFLTVSKLSEFCKRHADDIKLLDFYTLYSVIKLIDAAIERPFDVHNQGDHLITIRDILITNVSLSKSHNVNDIFSATRLKVIFAEVKSEWERLLKHYKPVLKQMTMSKYLTKSSDDYYDPY